ncbi:MAG: hypothetical protein CVV10_06310, partial [Gammaproteobacteria bacterium HGW-Gammaproteobacteria-14]
MKNGFTLIELLCALTVVVIVSLSVAPSLQRLIHSQRVIHTTNNVISLIYQGKGEAIVRTHWTSLWTITSMSFVMIVLPSLVRCSPA